MEIAAREIPYLQVRNDSIISGSIIKGKRASIDSAWPELFRVLIVQCWDQDPAKRPTAKQAVEALQKASKSTSAGSSRPSTAQASTLIASAGYAGNAASIAAPATPASKGYAMSSVAAALPPALPPKAVAKVVEPTREEKIAALANARRPETAVAKAGVFAPAAKVAPQLNQKARYTSCISVPSSEELD